VVQIANGGAWLFTGRYPILQRFAAADRRQRLVGSRGISMKTATKIWCFLPCQTLERMVAAAVLFGNGDGTFSPLTFLQPILRWSELNHAGDCSSFFIADLQPQRQGNFDGMAISWRSLSAAGG